jgi:hypothetical protein
MLPRDRSHEPQARYPVGLNGSAKRLQPSRRGAARTPAIEFATRLALALVMFSRINEIMAERTGLEPGEGANGISNLLIWHGDASPEAPRNPRIWH